MTWILFFTKFQWRCHDALIWYEKKYDVRFGYGSISANYVSLHTVYFENDVSFASLSYDDDVNWLVFKLNGQDGNVQQKGIRWCHVQFISMIHSSSNKWIVGCTGWRIMSLTQNANLRISYKTSYRNQDDVTKIKPPNLDFHKKNKVSYSAWCHFEVFSKKKYFFGEKFKN